MKRVKGTFNMFTGKDMNSNDYLTYCNKAITKLTKKLNEKYKNEIDMHGGLIVGWKKTAAVAAIKKEATAK
jgi:hypothetical protein